MEYDWNQYIFGFDEKPTEHTAQYQYTCKCEALKIPDKYTLIEPYREMYR